MTASERLVKVWLDDLGLQAGWRGVAAPIVRQAFQGAEEAMMLDALQASRYRRGVGQLLYISHDRPGVMYACREVA